MSEIKYRTVKDSDGHSFEGEVCFGVFICSNCGIEAINFDRKVFKDFTYHLGEEYSCKEYKLFKVIL